MRRSGTNTRAGLTDDLFWIATGAALGWLGRLMEWELLWIAAGVVLGWLARTFKARTDTKLLKAAEAVASLNSGEDEWADGLVVPAHALYCKREDGVWRCAPACNYRALRYAVACSKRGFKAL